MIVMKLGESGKGESVMIPPEVLKEAVIIENITDVIENLIVLNKED